MADDLVLVPVADPLIGAEFGSFVIVRRLGCGGMGAVYLAQHKAAPLVRRVLKTMLAHLAKHPMMIDRFNTEALAVGRLRHDNIVELNDFGVMPTGQLYLDFEYIDGLPLDRFLADHGGRLSLHRAVYLVFQVCDALDHAHAAGVVHRDLKPDNLLIIVDDEKRVPRHVKLVDFGISKVVRTGAVQTLSGMSMGTPYFMSVEQYSNAAEASNKSDVYSLAIILWLIVTGELPWGRPEPTVLYHLQRTVIPTVPAADVMPPAVTRILLRCFSPNPDDRPTMRELAVELAAVVPATDDAPSGGAILQHIARRFLTSAPYHARTVPHAAPANPDGVAAQLWPSISQLTTSEDDPAPAAEPPVPVMLSAQSPRVTAHASPRARAFAATSDGAAVPEPVPADAPATSSAFASALPGSVFAAFPTGLISQRHLAAEPPGAGTGVPRLRSVVAAAEIDVRVAQGTPGPQPYAHADLPPVVVSTTQLSAASRYRVRTAESPPILVLPPTARPRSHRRLIAICAGTGALAVVAMISAFQLREPSRDTQTVPASSGANPGATLAASAVASTLVPDAGIAEPAPPRVVSAPGVEEAAATGVGSSISSPAVASGSGSGAEPTPAHAVARLPYEQPPARVHHDGPVAPQTPSRSTGVAASTRASAKPVDRQIEAAPGRSAPSSQVEHPPPVDDGQRARTGTIIVRVPQTWAQVWIDQVDSGTTPVRAENIPVGPHKVLLVGASHRETVNVTVTAGGESVIERNW